MKSNLKPQQAHERFSADLNARIGEAVKDGCALEAIILELEMAKLYCHHQYMIRMQMSSALAQHGADSETTDKITKISGN